LGSGHKINVWILRLWLPQDLQILREALEEINKIATDASQEARDDKVPGGLADKKDESDFDPKALAKGMRVELEHTDDENLAKEIAMDHLVEDPDYYEKLEKMEQDAMDTLPIHADPILWTDEQLIETMSNPQLRKLIEERNLLAAVIREMKRRDLKLEITPNDIEKWRERGWFYIMWGSFPLGFVNNKSLAELIRSRIIRNFVENGTVPEGQDPPYYFGIARQAVAGLYDPKEWQRLEEQRLSGGSLSAKDEAKIKKRWKRAKKLARQELDDLLHHPLRKGKRKEFAERYVKSLKAGKGLQPSKESVISGGLPTRSNFSSSWTDIERAKYRDVGVEGSAEVAERKFFQDAARVITKRLKAEEEGQDPEKLSDDVCIASFPLSCR